MPDTREKLFDLMMRDPCPYPVHCSAGCDYYKSHHCHAERYADHLIAHGVTVQEWISVKDRLPEEGEIVLAFGKRHATSGMFRGTGNKPTLWWWRGNILKEVTHWMPLPEPPKEDA